MAWRLTKSMARFRALVDARWPDRDHASDGTIGDTAHQSSTSGHNPDDTAGSKPEWNGDPDTIAEVRAFDMDADLRESGTTAQMLVDHLRKLPGLSNVFRYIIYNRKIYHSSDGFKPADYTGSNPHTAHIHFSGAYTQSADDNETFDFKLDEVGDMALTSDDAWKVWNTDHCVPMPEWRSDHDANPDITAQFAMLLAMNESHGANVNAAAAKSEAAAVKTALASLAAKVDSLAAAEAARDTSNLAAILAAIQAGDVVDIDTLAEALVPPLAAAITASWPAGQTPLTFEEVKEAAESGLRNVLIHGTEDN